MSCPNCGAALHERRCAQCRAVVPSAGGDDARAERAARGLGGAEVARVFAMPLASTRPQSAGHGRRWWVCAAVKPTLERRVLLRGLEEGEAVAIAGALAARLKLD